MRPWTVVVVWAVMAATGVLGAVQTVPCCSLATVLTTINGRNGDSIALTAGATYTGCGTTTLAITNAIVFDGAGAVIDCQGQRTANKAIFKLTHTTSGQASSFANFNVTNFWGSVGFSASDTSTTPGTLTLTGINFISGGAGDASTEAGAMVIRETCTTIDTVTATNITTNAREGAFLYRVSKAPLYMYRSSFSGAYGSNSGIYLNGESAGSIYLGTVSVTDFISASPSNVGVAVSLVTCSSISVEGLTFSRTLANRATASLALSAPEPAPGSLLVARLNSISISNYNYTGTASSALISVWKGLFNYMDARSNTLNGNALVSITKSTTYQEGYFTGCVYQYNSGGTASGGRLLDTRGSVYQSTFDSNVGLQLVKYNGGVTGPRMWDSFFTNNINPYGNLVEGPAPAGINAVIQNNQFYNNTARDSILVITGPTTSTSNVFTLNRHSTGGKGAGLFNTQGNSVTIQSHIFNGNTGGVEGVFYLNGGSTSIQDSTFADNTSPGADASIAYLVGHTMSTTNCFFLRSSSNGATIYASESSPVSITGGNFTANTGTVASVIFAQRQSTTTLSRVVFSGNSASGYGTLYVDFGSLSIVSCDFRNNFGRNGGALYLGGSATAVISQATTFIGNTGLTGGAIYVSAGGLSATNATFTGNKAYSDAGTIYLAGNFTHAMLNCSISGSSAQNGGAIMLKQGTLSLTGSRITSSTAASTGGGLYGATAAYASFSDVTMSGNSAALNGGGIFWQARNILSCSNCRISHNVASGSGGGLSLGPSASVAVTGGSFANNSATMSGGGVSMDSNAALTMSGTTLARNRALINGGGVYAAAGATMTLSNGHIIVNVAASGGGVYASTATTVTLAAANVTGNTALTGNGGGIYSLASITCTSRGTWAANNATNGDGGALYSTGSLTAPAGLNVTANVARRGAGVACAGCALTTTAVGFQGNLATTNGAAAFCDPAAATSAVTWPKAVMTGAWFSGNLAGEEPSMEANCTACGCCDYGATVRLSAAQRCVLFPAISPCAYSCAPGYDVAASAYAGSVTCPVAGLTGAALCPPVACPALSTPSNGHITLSLTPAVTPAVATYVCDAGFVASGTGTLSCVGPNWIGASSYEPVVCTTLTSPEHGTVTQTGLHQGDTGTFTCAPGYELSSGNEALVVTCQNGVWSAASPSCNPGQCPDLAPPEFGSVIAAGRRTNNTATYLCNPGYQLVGSSTIVCAAPSWVGTPPTCSAIACPALTAPGNGSVSAPTSGVTFVTNDRPTFSCDAGFAIQGTTELLCIGPEWYAADGSKNVNETHCLPIACAGYPVEVNTSAECYGTSLPVGASCEVACKPGYEGPRYTATCAPVSATSTRGQMAAVGGGVKAPCRACDAGSYSTTGDTCTPCENGITKGTGATDVTQCECVVGFFEEVDMSGVCVRCPAGAACLGSRIKPIAAEGYYGTTSGYITCFPTQACLTNNTCAAGYTGYACSQCDKNYYRLSNECLACPGQGYWKAAVAAVFGGLVMLLLIGCAQPSGNNATAGLGASVNSGLNFVQIVAIFVDIRLPWPPILRRIMSVFSALNLNVELLNPECAGDFDGYDKFLLQILLPLGVLVLYFLVAALRVAWFACRERQAGLASYFASRTAVRFMAGYMMFLSLAYLFLARAGMSIFSCRANGDGVYLLSLSGDECYTSKWDSYAPVAAFSILMYIIGIPAACLYAAIRLNRHHGNGTAAYNAPSSFYVAKYSSRLWFWETVVMLRKVLVVAAVLFLVDNVISVTILISAILFFNVLASAALLPYRSRVHNIVEFTSLFGSLTVLFSGVVANSNSATAVSVADGLSALLVVLTMLCCAIGFSYELMLKLPQSKAHRKVQTVLRSTHLPSPVTALSLSASREGEELICHTAEHGAITLASDTLNGLSRGDDLTRVSTVVAVASGAGFEAAITSDHECILTVEGKRHTLPASKAVALTAAGDTLVVGTEDGTITCFHIHAKNAKKFSASKSARVSSSLTSATSEQQSSVSLSVSGSASRSQASISTEVWSTDIDVASPYCLTISGLTLIAVDADLALTTLDLETGARMKDAATYAFTAHLPATERHKEGMEPGHALALGEHLVVGTARGSLLSYNSATGESRNLHAHMRRVTGLQAWRERWVISASLDGTARVWDLESGTCIFTLRAPVLGFTALCVSGDMVFLGVEDGRVIVHSLQSLPRDAEKKRRRCCGRHAPLEATHELLAASDELDDHLHASVAHAVAQLPASSQRKVVGEISAHMRAHQGAGKDGVSDGTKLSLLASGDGGSSLSGSTEDD